MDPNERGMRMDDNAKNEDKTEVKTPASPAEQKSEDKHAKKSGDKPAKKSSSKKRGSKKLSFSTPVFVVIVVAAVVVGCLAGAFGYKMLPLPGSSTEVKGKSTVSEDQLDAVLATYQYNGQTYNITVQDCIEENSSLDSAKQDDGTYSMPSADTALSLARNQIMQKAAEDQGITVSDDDVDSYAESTLGSSDYSTIASQYSMDEDKVKELMKESCILKKLHDQVVTTQIPDQPTAPTQPASGQESTPTADYASYIINLAGDEWDSTNNTWASTDGPYYAALSSYTISNDSATYDAAEAAYYVAYSQYSQATQSAQQEWTDYANGLLTNASITLNSLVA